MDMDPKNFLNLAKRLFNDDTAECSHRTAVSRAYYAAYHVVKKILSKTFTIPDDVGGHKEVAKLLGMSKNPEVEYLGGSLWDLRKKRNRADYNLDDKDVVLPAKNVALTIGMAEAIIITIEKNRANLGIPVLP